MTQTLRRKRLRRMLLAASGLVVVVSLAALGVRRAWRHVPEFYTEALAVDTQIQERGNRAFLRKVAQVTSDTQTSDHWQIRFTDEEINGWLAVDLPKNYGDLLPSEFSEPRVRIDDTRLTIAVRHQADSNSSGSVFTVTASLYTLSENRIAVQLHSARVGIVPLPLDGIVEAITQAGKQWELPVVWQHSGGEPVAVVVLPSGDHDSALSIEHLNVADGALVASGRGRRADAWEHLPEFAERINPAATQSGANENVQR